MLSLKPCAKFLSDIHGKNTVASIYLQNENGLDRSDRTYGPGIAIFIQNNILNSTHDSSSYYKIKFLLTVLYHIEFYSFFISRISFSNRWFDVNNNNKWWGYRYTYIYVQCVFNLMSSSRVLYNTCRTPIIYIRMKLLYIHLHIYIVLVFRLIFLFFCLLIFFVGTTTRIEQKD